MKATYRAMMVLGLLVLPLALTGCDKASSTPPVAKKSDDKKNPDHPHGKGPNGGVVFDLGAHHAEFTVDHDKKECTILVLGADETTTTAVAAKDLTLTTKETKTKDGQAVPALTIKLVPKDEAGGKATKFVGADAGLGNVADFAGTVIGEIDGKPAQGEFKE